MTDELQEALQDIARDLLILNYKIGCWYCLAKVDPDAQQTKDAGDLLLFDAREFSEKLTKIVQGDT